MSGSLLIAMGRIILPDETDKFLDDRIKKWAKEFKPKLRFEEISISKQKVLFDIHCLGENHPIQAKLLHCYNLVMGNYYF